MAVSKYAYRKEFYLIYFIVNFNSSWYSMFPFLLFVAESTRNEKSDFQNVK